MVVGVSSEPPADGTTDALRRDPVVAIADYLDQFVADEPAADDRPDPSTADPMAPPRGRQITPTRVS